MAHTQFPCKQCGAKLEFAPGTDALSCPYCGVADPIEDSGAVIEELDFRSYLASAADGEDTIEQPTVKCEACAATMDMPPNVTSSECPFCGQPIVATASSTKRIKPKSLLPFAVPRDDARSLFRTWISKLWFAPNELKKYARIDHKLQGIYVPYWTYDSTTTTHYTGERGEDYWDTETYTETDSDGKRVTKTRRVRKTRWYSVRGTVGNRFDDILILASQSLPRKYTERLEPWDLGKLEPYADEYLSGFRSESYQVELEDGFQQATVIMDEQIRATICDDIGGDHQRIHSVDTRYRRITFKHILLPIWLSVYRYRDQAYRFLVNGRTGEVQGERPYSWAKIALVIGVVVIIGLVIAGLNMI